ncbi:hypothetical protein [Dactylosporangium sp. NPDC049140]|uniref:hypothetical protein n=1 Tax=Dactylosporangium sp. NPDC049140 TaxID=3155647 RepID=UPI0033FD8189
MQKTRYGLTRAQVDLCTRRRAAGDRAGACAAAGIALEADPAAVSARFGAEAGAALDDDLRHLVPDLLRWHVLRLYEHPARPVAGGAAIPLTVLGEHGLQLVPQTGATRFALRYDRLDPDRLASGLHGLRELWDDRHAAGLLARCGGYTRLPFFAPDGTRLEGEGPEAVTERVVADFRAGRGEQAWLEAGFDVDLNNSAPGWYQALENGKAPAAVQLAYVAWTIATRAGVGAVRIPAARYHRFWIDRLDPTGRVKPRLRVVDVAWDMGEPSVELPLTELYAPEDFWDLLLGRIAPGDLHPLVAAALFPARPASDPAGPPPMAPLAPVRVRCGPDWHEVAFRDGVLAGPHPPEELGRELALLAVGGPVPAGCAGAAIAWRGGPGRLPARLRELRAELFARAERGEADTVTALLDAGLDPHVRAGDGRSLLHVLPALVPDEAGPRLLHRLVAAGLDPAAPTKQGLTPLRHAQRAGAAPDLVAALAVFAHGDVRAGRLP